MKFGKYMEDNKRQEWSHIYINYKELKDLIKRAAAEVESGPSMSYSPRTTSLSVQRKPADSADEQFNMKLEEQVKRVGRHVSDTLNDMRKRIKELQQRTREDKKKQHQEELLEEAKTIGDEYLALEKFVNLNYLGTHKILKKHDKLVPHAPCRQFWIAHLHSQAWVQGSYSDLLVYLSNVYSEIRGDQAGQKNEDSAQGFVRSTTKYWVRTDDATEVKHHILQHLPVFQFVSEEGQQDSQLINSVYLDNSSMELYHGRLDKKPNAIALRIRWYSSIEPTGKVFVERKTHRESWKGEESVKERITLREPQVLPFLEGQYKVEHALKDQKFKNPDEEANFKQLFTEIQTVVESKQLRPIMRTQYYRTAFQVPFDARVRISLDTNLNMILENPEDAPLALAHRWFRDPQQPIPRHEITRFPHAVLEVKLSLPEGESAPPWVAELLESGFLTEVHKFSKFIHGSATLLPEMVQAVPYWVDDESVRPSMLQSAQRDAGGQHMDLGHAPQDGMPEHPNIRNKPRRRNDGDDELTHPLLGDQPTLQLLPPRDEVSGIGRRRQQQKKGFLDWWFTSRPKPAQQRPLARTTPMRVEPKTFFANERTFLTWLHMAVTVGTIAAALLGFSGSAERSTKQKYQGTEHIVEIIALILLPVAIMMCAYALVVFVWRARAISKKQVGYIDDPRGPLGLSVVVITALTAILILSIVDFIDGIRAAS